MLNTTALRACSNNKPAFLTTLSVCFVIKISQIVDIFHLNISKRQWLVRNDTHTQRHVQLQSRSRDLDYWSTGMNFNRPSIYRVSHNTMLHTTIRWQFQSDLELTVVSNILPIWGASGANVSLASTRRFNLYCLLFHCKFNKMHSLKFDWQGRGYILLWTELSTRLHFAILRHHCTNWLCHTTQWWFVDIRDDVIKWKLFPRYWPFVRGIHRSPVNSPHKGQWSGALMFSLICARINDWVNNGEAGDLRRYRTHYDVTVI